MRGAGGRQVSFRASPGDRPTSASRIEPGLFEQGLGSTSDPASGDSGIGCPDRTDRSGASPQLEVRRPRVVAERAGTRRPASRQRRVPAPFPHASNLVPPSWQGPGQTANRLGRSGVWLAAPIVSRPTPRGEAAVRAPRPCESRGGVRTQAGTASAERRYPTAAARRPWLQHFRTRQGPAGAENSGGTLSKGVRVGNDQPNVLPLTFSVDSVSNAGSSRAETPRARAGGLSGVSASVKGP